jgi:hypothetical protein
MRDKKKISQQIAVKPGRANLILWSVREGGHTQAHSVPEAWTCAAAEAEEGDDVAADAGDDDVAFFFTYGPSSFVRFFSYPFRVMSPAPTEEEQQ